MIRCFLFASSALAVALSAPPAFAQSSEDDEQAGIADIVVTAQRRSESVQDVPIAISAFSADQLAEQGITNTLQLSQ